MTLSSNCAPYPPGKLIRSEWSRKPRTRHLDSPPAASFSPKRPRRRQSGLNQVACLARLEAGGAYSNTKDQVSALETLQMKLPDLATPS